MSVAFHPLLTSFLSTKRLSYNNNNGKMYLFHTHTQRERERETERKRERIKKCCKK